MSDIDDFLDNPEIPVDTGADAAAEAAAQAEADRVAAEQAAAAKAAEEETAVAKAKAFEKAMLDERHKRQELEQQLAAKQEEEKPYLGEDYEARFKETESKFEQQLIAQKLNLSEAFAREKHDDFDDKLETFKAMITENPALYHQMVQQVNPAEFMYKTASNQLKLKEMGNPDEYEQKLREKITKEIEAKFEAEAKKRNELPGTLANQRGASGMQAQAWAGPTAIDDILK